jgi:hypothetical protein
VTRYGQPIQEYPLRDSVGTGISYSPIFEGLRAAVWAGATLDELKRWMDGAYPNEFMARVTALYRLDGLVRQHAEDAVNRAIEKRNRKKGQ